MYMYACMYVVMVCMSLCHGGGTVSFVAEPCVAGAIF